MYLALMVLALQQHDSSFVHKGDGKLAIAAVAATALTAAFDERIARWTRQPSVQGDSSRSDVVKAVTVVNEVPLTIGAVATYGIGRLTGNRTVADVGAHLTQSLVATEVVAEIVRSGLGRTRPRASQDDAFAFKPGGGLTRFEYRSWPSLHAAVAFATAASLSEEMRVHDMPGRAYATWALYGAALIPGFTRLYLDQHWASDVVAGAAVGAYLGHRVTQYSHRRRTRIDRILLSKHVSIVGPALQVRW